jgi:hypothetical protein
MVEQMHLIDVFMIDIYPLHRLAEALEVYYCFLCFMRIYLLYAQI